MLMSLFICFTSYQSSRVSRSMFLSFPSPPFTSSQQEKKAPLTSHCFGIAASFGNTCL